ncbi:hypothetical protein C8R43DRAFT_553776 [Mycena crocata]|nr:hypothetical protein C8R43DRAFT_553776 [Mycena crocata]
MTTQTLFRMATLNDGVVMTCQVRLFLVALHSVSAGQCGSIPRNTCFCMFPGLSLFAVDQSNLFSTILFKLYHDFRRTKEPMLWIQGQPAVQFFSHHLSSYPLNTHPTAWEPRPDRIQHSSSSGKAVFLGLNPMIGQFGYG